MFPLGTTSPCSHRSPWHCTRSQVNILPFDTDVLSSWSFIQATELSRIEQTLPSVLFLQPVLVARTSFSPGHHPYVFPSLAWFTPGSCSDGSQHHSQLASHVDREERRLQSPFAFASPHGGPSGFNCSSSLHLLGLHPAQWSPESGFGLPDATARYTTAPS